MPNTVFVIIEAAAALPVGKLSGVWHQVQLPQNSGNFRDFFLYLYKIHRTCFHQKFDSEEINNNAFYMPDADAAVRAGAYLEKCMKSQDSAGGVVECRITGVPAGLGSPVFEKLDAVLAQAVMSVGAVKAVEIGDGTEVAHMNGSDDNDGFHFENGQISKTSNHAGGIMGGISDGSEIILRAYIKPTPSISQPQETTTCNGKNISLEIHGRHDPVIVPRAVVVIESMCALAITDALFCQYDFPSGLYSEILHKINQTESLYIAKILQS